MPGPIRHVEKAKNSKKALGNLAMFSKRYVWGIIIALCLAAFGAVLTILGPNKIGEITDFIKDGLFGNINMNGITQAAIFLCVIYGISFVCNFLQHYIMSTVTQKISKNLRTQINKKIAAIPLKYFSSHAYGDVLSRITNDVDTISQSMSNSLAAIVSSVAQFIGCLIMMFITNWSMALTAITATIVGLILMIVIMKNSQKYFKQKQQALGSINGYVEEMYHGHDVIRVSNGANSVKSKFKGLNDNLRKTDFKSQFLSGLMQPLMNFMGNLGYVAVCIVGAVLTINGRIEFGVITAFILYVRLFETPLRNIAQSMTQIQAAAAASERVFEFLQEEEMENESDKQQTFGLIDGCVEFKNVKFAYPNNPDKEIIHNFSLMVNSGQKIAIVGPTGAGKTTIVNLLMRFFELSGGSISIDGVDISTVSKEAVHDAFGMVLQDTWLFEGTLRENLVFNLDGITDEQLDKVCNACGLMHFVDTLPNRYDTVLNDNTDISVGQKQLLTIARAMLQNSPMLILDEATSSIDTKTEMVVQQAMDKLTSERTSFVIAHRLSTIKNADIILCLRDGDIVEQGDHETLLNKKGFYYELYNSQFETAI